MTTRNDTNSICNALTVDVEDWVQSVFDPNAPLTKRFVKNTERVLCLFERCGVKATFFFLGLAAEKAPRLVRRVQACGHEIQSHGYGHRLVHTLTEAEFRADLDRSKKLLEDITGGPITGYRAPAFSIGQRNLWALDVIATCGFTFDASLCPAKTRRYGIPHAPRGTHRIITPHGQTLREVPVATASFLGRRVPAGGGGYLRLFPVRFVRRAIEVLNRTGSATAIYMHPHEFAPSELRELSASTAEDLRIPWKTRLHQGLGRARFAKKLETMLRSCRFGTMHDVLTTADHWSTYRYATDGTITPTPVIEEASAPEAGGDRDATHATTNRAAYGLP